MREEESFLPVMQESAKGNSRRIFCRRPKRFPGRGLNERSSHSVTRDGNASGKQAYLSPALSEDETITGDRKGEHSG